ncbi:hypothetical protein Bra471DRAFT_04398 [Bradyrhizobium sp. WSM471]|nr:hypothetical protein Bra471DRAFT_04398 [Bradyrhizobium sp. WSM471]
MEGAPDGTNSKDFGTNHFVHFYTEFPEQNTVFRSLQPVGTSTNGCITVLGKNYLTRQASLLLEFARTTSDSDLSAKLVSKAADLKSQADPLPDKDQGPKAPDVTPGQAGS